MHGAFVGLHKEVSNPGSAQAYEHLDEPDPLSWKKGTWLSSDSFGSRVLPVPWDRREERLRHLPDLGPSAPRNSSPPTPAWPVHACHILEGDVQLILHVDFRLFCQGSEAGLLACHPLQEIPDPDKESDGEDPEKVSQKGRFHLAFESDRISRSLIFPVHPNRPEGFQLVGVRLVHFHLALNLVHRYGDLGHPILLNQIKKLAVRNGFDGKHGSKLALNEQNHPHAEQHIPNGKLVMFFHTQPPLRLPVLPPLSDLHFLSGRDSIKSIISELACP
jgi:hypothetical protein